MRAIYEKKQLNQKIFSLFANIFIDFVIILGIGFVGWFLIGYYTDYQYLATGYQDWIYHAFRIQSIERHGIVSWDNIWSNGINYWRAYQYIPHVFILGTAKLFSLSITKAMLWWIVVVFIGIRVELYIIFRALKIKRLFAVFAIIITYVFPQQWIAIEDFSIFIVLFLVPLYVAFWIYASNHKKYLYPLAAVAGFFWSLHPVLGYSSAGLLFFLILFSKTLSTKEKSVIASVFLLSSLAFSIPYLLAGYHFMDPIFASSQFLRETIVSEYFGLGLIYFILLGVSWFILFIKAREIEKWTKMLLVFCSLYLLLIYLGQNNYLPHFINQFQISRAIPIIALLLSFCFASLMQVAFKNVRSRFVFTILIILIAINITKSIEVSSRYSGQPVNHIENPVAQYFFDKDTDGSIYFQNVSEASFFGKEGMRYVVSYNNHLQPHPYSTRIGSLMKTDISFTGVSDKQIKLINDYAVVLGIEYIFIPQLSPLVNGLTDNNFQQNIFEKVGEITVSSESFAILHNKQPIHYAYIFEKNQVKSFINFESLPKPTLDASSFNAWDKEISKLAELIRSKSLKPIPLQFVDTDKLTINVSDANQFENPAIFITQSYDQNWRVENIENLKIIPTNLKFMYIVLPREELSSKILELKNSWPKWYWPIQASGIVMIVISSISVFVIRNNKNKKEKNEY